MALWDSCRKKQAEISIQESKLIKKEEEAERIRRERDEIELEAKLKSFGQVVQQAQTEEEWSLEKAQSYFQAQAQAREILRKRHKQVEEAENKVQIHLRLLTKIENRGRDKKLWGS